MLRLVPSEYVHETDAKELIYASIRGALRALYPGSTFHEKDGPQDDETDLPPDLRKPLRDQTLAAVSDALMLTDEVGDVRVNEFDEETQADLEAALNRLAEDGMRALVLDIRGNSGGLLEATIGVACMFFKREMLIASTYGRTRDSQLEYCTQAPGSFPRLPSCFSYLEKRPPERRSLLLPSRITNGACWLEKRPSAVSRWNPSIPSAGATDSR